MRTIKEIFNSNLEENITFEYFSIDGYRVYSKHHTTPVTYFHYKNKKEVNIDIIDINTVEKIKCPECKKDDDLKIQRSKGKNTKYECKNKACHTRFFKILSIRDTDTLEKLVKSHFGIQSIREHKKTYDKYHKMYINSKRIIIDDEDIQYLEHYLMMKVPRDLIADLFSVSTRTLRRFIKLEESRESIGKSRFQKDEPVDTDKELIIHSVKYHTNLFKSEITYSYIDLDYEAYKTPKYHIEKKCNKKIPSPHTT